MTYTHNNMQFNINDIGTNKDDVINDILSNDISPSEMMNEMIKIKKFIRITCKYQDSIFSEKFEIDMKKIIRLKLSFESSRAFRMYCEHSDDFITIKLNHVCELPDMPDAYSLKVCNSATTVKS